MKLGLSRAKSPDKLDYVLIAILITMAISSICSIYAASGILGKDVAIDYIIKQIMWFIIGAIAMAILRYLGNDNLLDFAKIAYWIIMGMLILLLIGQYYYKFTGVTKFLWIVSTVNGATSWFDLPGLGSLQPSEFMKIVLIIITANIIDEHNQNKVMDSYEMDFQLIVEIAKWAVPPMALIFLQPDTGVCIIIAISLGVMILCSGIKKQWFIIIGSLVIISVLGFFFLYFYAPETLAKIIGGQYKVNRISGWLNPESDILGDGHQLYMALLVLGSAGITGHGIGQSLVAIPEAQTDFIFSVIGQSWGLLGTLFILALCLILDLKLCSIAMNCKNMVEKYFIIGIIGILLYQQVQNIGMIVGLLPITGITLPLISYGGSSLLSYLIAFGIILNASSKAKKLSDYVYD